MRHLLSADALIVAVLLAFGSTGSDADAPDRSAVPVEVGEPAAEELESGPLRPEELEALLDELTSLLSEGTVLDVDTEAQRLPVDVYTGVFDKDPRSIEFVGLYGIGRVQAGKRTVWVIRDTNETAENEHAFLHVTRDASGDWQRSDLGRSRGYHCDTSIDTKITVADDGILEVETTTTPPDCLEGEEPDPPTVERFRMHPDGRREALSGE